VNPEIQASYAACRQLARRATSNFVFSFALVPREKRQAMWALYAFLRQTDDLADRADSDENKRAALVVWRNALDMALAGDAAAAAANGSPVFPALADTVRRYTIPAEYLYAVIDGVEMDLDERTFATFDELSDYCYHVASVVGLACINVWGFRDPAALELARDCGIAFQLTNILRDLKEDAAAGRIYLPLEDLARFNYTVDDLRNSVLDDRQRALVHFEISRAEGLYGRAARLIDLLEPDGKPIFGAMFSTYRGLLEEIKRRDGDVFRGRASIGAFRKLRIAVHWMFRKPSLAGTPSAIGPGAR